MEPGWQPGDFDADQAEEKFFDAARLYDHVVSGGRIQPVATSLRLEDGEFACADEQMEYSRFYSEDIDLWMNPFNSPYSFVGTMIRNRINRESGEAQWRWPHATRVALTNRRLLIVVDHCWESFPHDEIAEFLPDINNFSLVLTLHENFPLRLRAPDLPARAVMLGSFLYPPEQLTQIKDFHRFA